MVINTRSSIQSRNQDLTPAGSNFFDIH